MSGDKLTGIEEMRAAVRLFDQCAESFNERFHADDLIKIYRAHMACEWDLYPDQWADEQVSRVCRFGADAAPMFREMTAEDRAMWLQGRLRLVAGLVPIYGVRAPAPRYLPEPGDHSSCDDLPDGWAICEARDD